LRGDTESGGTEISLRAIYEGGVFRPLQQVDLPDKTHVVITVKVPKTAAGLLAILKKYQDKIRFSAGEVEEFLRERRLLPRISRTIGNFR